MSIAFYQLRSSVKAICLLVGLVVLFTVQSAPVQGGESKSSRAASIKSQLQELGYSPSTDSDGDVVFKDDDLSFCIILDEDDDDYYRVTLPAIDELDDDNLRNQLSAILSLSTKCKSVKFFITDSNKIWISVENFYSSSSRFNKVLPRTISTIKNAYLLYKMKVLLGDD